MRFSSETYPMPGESLYELYNTAAYRSGVVLPNAGHVRIRVSKSQATVSYVRFYLPEDENNVRKNGKVAYSYTVPAKVSSEHQVTRVVKAAR
jgi:hypothetical protein